MFDISSKPFAGSLQAALILDDDIPAREALRHTLDSLGYQTWVVADTETALEALRASAETVALFFDVEAYEETLDGHGYVSLIGALLEDVTLAHRHILVAISSTPDDVEWTLGKVLARLDAPIFGKPCAADVIRVYLTTARRRLASERLPQMAPTIWMDNARPADGVADSV